MSIPNDQRGIILITTMYLLVVLLALLAAFFIISTLEMKSMGSSRKSIKGFYGAEAGLNLRAEEIRQIFVGYNRPSGSTPNIVDACMGGNQGSGDFQCKTYDLDKRSVVTYIEEDASNPIITTIPPGELYQNLNAQEYRYTINSTAFDQRDRAEAILELRFKSRLVPLFQFIAFYNKDLEILPGPTMNLSGPVHSNGDLYMQSDATLSITGQVTSAGVIYRGRKNDATCRSNSVRIMDPAAYRQLVPACPARTLVDSNDIQPFNGMVHFDVEELTVPEPEALDPTPGEVYWDFADLRLVLSLTAAGTPNTTNSVTGVEVRNSDNSLNASATNNLHSASCTGQVNNRPIGTSSSFYNNRENKNIRMLDIDMRNLLNCLNATTVMSAGKSLSDASEGGLVLYFTVEGPNSASNANNYGVRIRNAQTLQATSAGAPVVKGMTVVSDQAVYTWGHYNSSGWIPAAILSDSLNVLSVNWRDAGAGGFFNPNCPNGASCSTNSGTGSANVSTTNRAALNTTVYTAILSGTDTTGGVDGIGGQGGAYNGGLENYPRFHEYWTSRTLSYLGSFVSLNTPRHVNGTWIYGGRYYTAPNRAWDYDTRFNDAANLPPLTPRFVYLRQELFVRDFEQ